MGGRLCAFVISDRSTSDRQEFDVQAGTKGSRTANDPQCGLAAETGGKDTVSMAGCAADLISGPGSRVMRKTL